MWEHIDLERKLRAVIEEDENLGFYVYVYTLYSKDPDVWKLTHDYLQDTLDIAKSFAGRKFQIPRDEWVEKK